MSDGRSPSTTGDEPEEPTVVEVFADVCCPFAHVGLRRFVEHRAALGRDDVVLHVRAWPLELVNGHPLDPRFIAEEIDEIRTQLGPGDFTGFRPEAFPHSSLPALDLASRAYGRDLRLGEAVSLDLRDRLFERGEDIADPAVLADVAGAHDLAFPEAGVGEAVPGAVAADHDEGRRRGVIGSPHFFTPVGDFFCPALDVSRDPAGHLRITADPAGFARFVDACFA